MTRQSQQKTDLPTEIPIPERVTLRQVAEHAGVPLPTVGNIMGKHRSRYSGAVQELVLRSAEQLGYRPNSSAKAMRRGSFGALGLLLSTNAFRSTLPAPLLNGLLDALAEMDLSLTVCKATDSALTSDAVVPKILRENHCDGFLVNYTDHIPEEMLTILERHKIPTVWLNIKLPTNCVHPDDFEAARRATHFLAEAGHRRIAYVQTISWEGHYSCSDRRDGYLHAVSELGFEPFIYGDLDAELGEKGTDGFRPGIVTLLDTWIKRDGVTAGLGYSPIEVHPLLRAMERQGFQWNSPPPVVGFSDSWMADAGRPVPTMLIPFESVGRHGVSMMREILAGTKLARKNRSIPYIECLDCRSRR